MNITYEQVRQSEEIRTYITQADQSLVARGFTEHSFAHVTRCAEYAARILDKLGYGEHDQELARIAGFMHDIGNVVNRHDHAQTGVRRSRVRNKEHQSFDIHDRVNYAAERSDLTLDPEQRTITLSLSINTEFCAVMDYFEIFLERMLLCRRAAEFLGLTFKLDINGLGLL